MPLPLVPLPRTQAPNTEGVLAEKPENESTTSAEEALPASVPATLCSSLGARATPFSLAMLAARRAVSSGAGLATRFMVFTSKFTSRSSVRRVRNLMPFPASPWKSPRACESRGFGAGGFQAPLSSSGG